MTDHATDPTLAPRSGSGSDRFHHHRRRHGSERAFRELDQDGSFTALCGARRPALLQPLRHPCCPRCNALISQPCRPQRS